MFKLQEMVKQDLRETYNEWKNGGHQEWVTLDTISEKYENHPYFDDIDGEALQEEIREEMESL